MTRHDYKTDIHTPATPAANTGAPDGIFRRVMFVCPSMRVRGGISSVLHSYKDMLPGFRHLATNSRLGTGMSMLKVAGIYARLVWMRPFSRVRIIHIHSGSGKSWMRKSMILSWAKLFGYKVVLHVHGGGFKNYIDRTGASRIKRLMGRCDAVVTLTHGWARYFTEEIGLTNVTVINNVVAPVAPAKIAARLGAAPRGTQERPMRFIFLGRICQPKGVYDLAEVIGRNAGRWRGRALFTIGGTGEDDRLAALIDRLGIGDMVETPGWVDGADKLRLIDSADVMVLPSYIECLPVTLLEAMAAAMPSIATEVGGIPEIITSGENGILFPPVDHDALERAIDHYLDHPGDVTAHGREGLRRVPEFYPDAVKEQLRGLYTSILASKH